MNQNVTTDVPLAEYRNQRERSAPQPPPPATSDTWNEGRVLAVIGRAGSGTSTTAIAAAQGFAERFGPSTVVLADLSRTGDQALLHDTPDVVPSFEDLAAATDPPPDYAQTCTFQVVARAYDLLLGLRRRREWASVTHSDVSTVVEALRSAYRVVVCDIDDDLDGGSVEAEARNCAARHVVGVADAVLVTGTATLTGLRSMLLTLDDLRALGVEPNRLRPMLTRVPSRRHRRQHAAALAALSSGGSELAGAAQSMESPQTEDAHHNGTRLVRSIVRPAIDAVADLLGEAPPPQPARVANTPRGPQLFHRATTGAPR